MLLEIRGIMSNLIKLFVCFVGVGSSVVAANVSSCKHDAESWVEECFKKYYGLLQNSPCPWGAAESEQRVRLYAMMLALNDGYYDEVRNHFIDFSFTQVVAAWKLLGSSEAFRCVIIKNTAELATALFERADKGESIFDKNKRVIYWFYTFLNKVVKMNEGVSVVVFRALLKSATEQTINFLEQPNGVELILEQNKTVLSKFDTFLNEASRVYGLQFAKEIARSRKSVEIFLRYVAWCKELS